MDKVWKKKFSGVIKLRQRSYFALVSHQNNKFFFSRLGGPHGRGPSLSLPRGGSSIAQGTIKTIAWESRSCALVDIQLGRADDTFGWMHQVC